MMFLSEEREIRAFFLVLALLPHALLLQASALLEFQLLQDTQRQLQLAENLQPVPQIFQSLLLYLTNTIGGAKCSANSNITSQLFQSASLSNITGIWGDTRAENLYISDSYRVFRYSFSTGIINLVAVASGTISASSADVGQLKGIFITSNYYLYLCEYPSRVRVTFPSASYFPTSLPTTAPPSASPSTARPSRIPTIRPSTRQPTIRPSTRAPSARPTFTVTSSSPASLSSEPTVFVSPTSSPSSLFPTNLPSSGSYVLSTIPSSFPSNSPSSKPPSSQPSSSNPSTTPSSSFPSAIPSSKPSVLPSSVPSVFPTPRPSSVPSVRPSLGPSQSLTVSPSFSPTENPSTNPTLSPTFIPTQFPSNIPTYQPTIFPSLNPSFSPVSPSIVPIIVPSLCPSSSPTYLPSKSPTLLPSLTPTTSPSIHPSFEPTLSPSILSSENPSKSPSFVPSYLPTFSPTIIPTLRPTVTQTFFPSVLPTNDPSNVPTVLPTPIPTLLPSRPTTAPTLVPTLGVTSPSFLPTAQPSVNPTLAPTSVISVEWPDGRFVGNLFFISRFLQTTTLTSQSVTFNNPLSAASSFIIFGGNDSSSTSSTITLDSSSSSHSFYAVLRQTEGKMYADTLSRSVVGIGDFNGDDSDDLMMGYPLVSATLVYFGSTGGFKNIHVSYGIYGETTSDYPTNKPNQLTNNSTRSPSLFATKRPSRSPTTMKLSYCPSRLITGPPSFSPTRQPSYVPTVTPSLKPSVRPSRSPSVRPSRRIIPTSEPSSYPTFPSSVSVLIQAVGENDSIVTGVSGREEIFQIQLSTGQTVQIKGGRGKKVYEIYPQSNSKIIISDFDPTNKGDVIDFSQISGITSLNTLSYSTSPLTFILLNEQYIVLSSYEIFNFTSNAFIFSSLGLTSSSSSSSSSSSTALSSLGVLLDVQIIVPALLAIFLSVGIYIISHREQKNHKGLKRVSINKSKVHNEDSQLADHPVSYHQTIEKRKVHFSLNPRSDLEEGAHYSSDSDSLMSRIEEQIYEDMDEEEENEDEEEDIKVNNSKISNVSSSLGIVSTAIDNSHCSTKSGDVVSNSASLSSDLSDVLSEEDDGVAHGDDDENHIPTKNDNNEVNDDEDEENEEGFYDLSFELDESIYRRDDWNNHGHVHHSPVFRYRPHPTNTNNTTNIERIYKMNNHIE
eukprot:gene5196-5566_t